MTIHQATLSSPSVSYAKQSENKLRAMRIWLAYLMFSLLSAPALYFLAIPRVPIVHQALAYVVFVICTLPVAVQMVGRNPTLPVFPIICLVYASGYALPIFLTLPVVVSMSSHGGLAHLNESDITFALTLSALGILCMQLGFWFFRFSVLHLLIPRVRLLLNPGKAKRYMNAWAVVGLGILWMTSTGRLNIPKNFFYIFILVTKFASLSLALLYYYYLKGELTPKEHLWLALIALGISGLALGSGNLRSVFDPLIIVGGVYWMVNHRFPFKYVIGGAILFFLLQPVKAAFREQVWGAGFRASSITQRLEIWWTLLENQWMSPLNKSSSPVESAARVSLNRTDIIHTFARVVSLTPRHVPYQLGDTYSYFFYAFIPRFLWPGKPGAQSANGFFGVAYDFQTPDSVAYTSIGMPHLVESYVNFGPVGVVFVMILIGMVYAAFDWSLNHDGAGEGGVALYATLTTSLWTIETATAPTFGALLQTTFVYAVVLSLVRLRPEREKAAIPK